MARRSGDFDSFVFFFSFVGAQLVLGGVKREGGVSSFLPERGMFAIDGMLLDGAIWVKPPLLCENGRVGCSLFCTKCC